MILLASLLVIRRIASLISGLPATIAAFPSSFFLSASSATSSRKSPLTFLVSSPWQAKHLPARIGRTSRLKSIVLSAAETDDAAIEEIRNRTSDLLIPLSAKQAGCFLTFWLTARLDVPE